MVNSKSGLTVGKVAGRMGGGLDRTAAVLLDGEGASRRIRKNREHASRGCARLRILGGTIGQVALFVAVLGAAAAAAAPSITTSGNADVQARIDCPLQLELDVFGVGLNRSQIWGAFDEGLGLPPGAMMGCHGQNVPIGGGLQVCIGGPIVISFSPTPMHAGRSYSAVLHWSGGFDGVSGAVQATAHTNISISVSRPSVAFLRQQGDSPDDVQHHFTFNVGCPESFAIEAADISPPATPSAIASGASCTSSYPVSITTAPDGAFPPSSNGLPQAIPARDVSGAMVGAAELVSAEGDDRNGVRRMELRWTPARGHESSKPYRICFRASTAAALGADGSAVRCVSVKVQKCQYCVQEGETIKTVAAMFDTDWLHIYTANPTVRNPDDLAVHTRVNTGAFYSAKKGDYLDLVAQKFFTTRDQLLIGNPDLTGSMELVEGDELCVLPPVCAVECKHGLDCSPPSASTAL